ncbi:MAG: rhomboid family intramembrane serine protease [Thermodesulfobacteriota bacterium]|nr:rhomboid family intramembrane serine protease [Thermodesulfobacteriota bacterium]
MKIRYNSPVILSYALAAVSVSAFSKFGLNPGFLASPAGLDFSNPHFYVKLVSYIACHSGWSHLIGNLMIILLVGPLLEEKYGSFRVFEMIIVTAVVTALLNAFLFSTSLIGGSGIAFMLILLSSFSNIRSGDIPLTFILIAVLFIGSEVVSILKIDRISQFSHLAGGFVGASYGFLRSTRR